MNDLASYYNGKNVDNVIEKLPDKTANMIKRTYLNQIIAECPDAKLSAVEIVAYYGEYNECFAVYVKDNYRVINILVEPEYKVGESTFFNFFYPRSCDMAK